LSIVTDYRSFGDVYIIGQLVSQHKYGDIRKCIDKNNDTIKTVRIINKHSLKEREENCLKDEISILKKLDHPNVIKVYEIFEDNDRYYLV